MKKRIISISLTVLFLGLIVAPTVIVLLDNSIDTSIFYSITEEENSKATNLLSPFSSESNDISTDFSQKVIQSFCYRFKHYPKPHLNLISPPPELSIL